MAYEIEFATTTKAHLSYLTASERARVMHEIVVRLADEPLVEARNRKPLRSNPLAPWELRLGALRVFYEVDRWNKGRPMKRVSVAKASRSLGEYATELEDEIVVVTELNRPVAALVPLKGIDCESLAVSTHPDFLRLIERSRAEIAAGKSLTLEDVQRYVASIAAPRKRRRSLAAKRNSR